MAEFLRRKARVKPTYGAFRSGICLLLALLLVVSVQNRTHAGSTLFDDDYEDCLGNQRLSDVLGDLEASRPAADHEMQLTWTATDPTTWNIETLEAEVTIIVEGPTKTMTRVVPLGTRTARFDENEIDMAQRLSIEMAVTQGNCVVSDIVETEFLSGMFRPDFSSPFFWDGNMMYKKNNNLPVGTFYFLGFGHNFDNWYVDSEETPRFWVGLRHGLAQPYEGEFLHYRLQITDAHGDDVLGFYPATVSSPDYENTIFALGKWADTDVQPQNMAEFANIRRSNHPNTPTPAAHETVSPVNFYWDNDDLGNYPQMFESASDTSALGLRLSFADLADAGTRGLYAHSPDHIYNLPVDTFDLDDRYTITAWAENVAGQRISDFAFITFKVREVLTVNNAFSNLQPLAIRQQRSQRPDPSSGPVYKLFRKAATFPADHVILTAANTADESEYSGDVVASAELPLFYNEQEIDDLSEYRLYGPLSGNSRPEVNLQLVSGEGIQTTGGTPQLVFVEEPSSIRSRSFRANFNSVEEAEVVNLLILDQSPTAKSKTGENWHAKTKSDNKDGGHNGHNGNGDNNGGGSNNDPNSDPVFRNDPNSDPVFLNDPNSDPVFLTSTPISLEENTASVPRMTAQDTDSEDSIESFALVGGADSALFNFSSSGDLAFISAPDYERPTDSNANNEYIVDISVASGTGDRSRTVTQAFTIEVGDAIEVPGVPKSLTATSTSSTISLYWLPADNTGPPLDGYQVQYREETASIFQDGPTTSPQARGAGISQSVPFHDLSAASSRTQSRRRQRLRSDRH